MTRSPVALARWALAVAERALPTYGSKFSRHDFTQPQLFAALVLKRFFQTDYRGISCLLADLSDLRTALKLTKVPHYSTLCYAEQRLLRQETFEALLAAVFAAAQASGLLEARPRAAVDATGLETRHASLYFVRRTGYRRFLRRHWPKLTLVCHTATHLLAAAVVTDGPSQDSPQFPAALRQAARHFLMDTLLGDAAYDAEHNHRLAREEFGVRSTVIRLNRRRSGRQWPKTRYRGQMRRRFHRRVYRERSQAESAISRHKRRLGARLRARTSAAQERECLVRVITHDLMILRHRRRLSTEP
jgi:hypothetical protein